MATSAPATIAEDLTYDAALAQLEDVLAHAGACDDLPLEQTLTLVRRPAPRLAALCARKLDEAELRVRAGSRATRPRPSRAGRRAEPLMRALLSNAAFWLPLSVAFGVQLYKMLANWVQTGRMHWHILAQAGGMPSSHSAMVAAWRRRSAIRTGWTARLFAIAAGAGRDRDVRCARRAPGERQAGARHQPDAPDRLFRPPPHRRRTQRTRRPHHLQVLVGGLIGVSTRWPIWSPATGSSDCQIRMTDPNGR
jgi:acid phosphatase family membrane protein YuiD/exonuclease VII small subunit